MNNHSTESQRAVEDIRREVAADHYRRTHEGMIKELCDVMRAEVAASPGVIRLDMNHCCHLCGKTVGEESRSARNKNLFLCAECRNRLRKKT